MKLQYVTMTGADESVDPKALIELSKEFPFVEWGILIGSQSGMRFPSVKWIENLLVASGEAPERIHLSLHICGRWLRGIAAGRSDLDSAICGIGAFDRCQLNWHGERQGNIGEKILAAFCNFPFWEPQIIFQMDGVNDLLWEPCGRKFFCGGLFDRSHGAGVLPDQWPQPLNEIQSGYAGGIGPDNIESELQRISAVTDFRPIWIDMETKIRSDDGGTFDLSKVRWCLEKAAPFAI